MSETDFPVTDFLNTPLSRILERRRAEAPGEHAVQLFHDAAARVPAYRAFLEAHGFDPASVRSAADFSRVPLTTKENYMRAYPLPDRCWDGKLERCEMIAVSSGSTGVPLFWPRSIRHEMEVAVRFEQVFHDSFQAADRSTLAIVCFTMGTWVGGVFTANCLRYLAQKGYPISVVTPGNNMQEILRCVRELGPHFDQVALLGYPPFLKEVVDTGIARGIDCAPFRVKMVMAGEVFSEEWRTLVGNRIGSTSPTTDFASIYGTADAGVLGNETPLSISIRRFLSQQPELARGLFGESRLPTLVQYDPMSRYFETSDGTLLFSGDSGVPLIRYHIADAGGVVPYDAMMTLFLENAPDQNVAEGPIVREMPFVYVFGRSDFTVSYFGANIYPENVTVGLEQPPIPEWVSGKFVLEVEENDDRNPVLSVVVELLPGVKPDDEKEEAIGRSIRANLERLNSEFMHYTPAEYRTPRITLAQAGDPDYFPAGVKHRYTRKPGA